MSEQAPVMIWMSDAEGGCLQLNRCSAISGASDDAASAVRLGDVHASRRRAGDRRPWARRWRRHAVSVKGRYRNAEGDYRVLETDARPRCRPGRVPRHDRRQHRHHRTRGGRGAAGAPARRADHRVKNTLAVVQALAHQTFRRPGRGGRAGRSRVAWRRSRAHDLLTQASWDTRRSPSSPTTRCAPTTRAAPGRRSRDPRCCCRRSRRWRSTLALHELYTNALKYGALSNEEGCVALNWRQTGDALRLAWTEAGGPPVAPPGRRGFGSVLIERALAHDCDATVRLEYLPAGLSCTIEMPLPPAGR